MCEVLQHEDTSPPWVYGYFTFPRRIEGRAAVGSKSFNGCILRGRLAKPRLSSSRFLSALINSTPCSRSGGYRPLLPCTLYILSCTGFSVRGGGSTFKQAFSVTYLSGSGDLGLSVLGL